MSASGFLRMQKLKGAGKVLAASRHNKRQIQAEHGAGGHIDAARIRLNMSLHGPGTPEEVANLARSLMAAAGVKPQKKNAVLAIEQIFSLPPNTTIEPEAYFRDCLKWAAEHFGGLGNVLSADVHLDESQPHLHVLILPLIDGRMNGSDMFGNRQRLQFLHTDLHAAVAGRYGLQRAPARLQGAAREKTAQTVIKAIQSTNDAAVKSVLWPVVRDLIGREPAAFAQAMGLDVAIPAAKKARTMTQIFTGKGKGSNRQPRPIGFDSSAKPIGLAAPAKGLSLCSVGITHKQPTSSPVANAELSTGTDGACDVPDGAVGNSVHDHGQKRDDDTRVIDRGDCEFSGWQDAGQLEPDAWR